MKNLCDYDYFFKKKYVWPLRWRNFLLMAIGIMVFKYIMFFL